MILFAAWLASGADPAGQTTWARDLDVAHATARANLEQVATARGWSPELRAWALAIVDAYAAEADGWISDDVPAFWTDLARHFADVVSDGSIQLPGGAVVPLPVGFDRLAAAWSTAAAAAGGTATQVELSTAWRQAADATAASVDDARTIVEETAQTIRDVGTNAGKAAKKLRQGRVLAGVAIAGGALLGLGVLWKVTR